MRKNVLWMLAAILTCGLSLTSCWKGGSNTDLLLGNWFLTMEEESYGEPKITYALFSIGLDGVITERVYWIFPEEPANFSERMRRHSIYTVNETLNQFDLDDGESVQTIRYQLTSGELTLTTSDGSSTMRFRRPTELELERLSVYDHFLWSDDYIGRWFFTNRFGDLTIYGMLHFTNNGLLEFVRYSYYSDDDCLRTKTTLAYNDYEDYEDQLIEIHEPKDYSSSTVYHWRITDDNLKLELYEEEDDDPIICHPLNPDDVELMARLDKLVR